VKHDTELKTDNIKKQMHTKNHIREKRKRKRRKLVTDSWEKNTQVTEVRTSAAW
jgi:hypothetical protein